MRILRRDFARYNSLEEEAADDVDTEYGWKIIHTDVFRLPQYTTLFCSILGMDLIDALLNAAVLLSHVSQSLRICAIIES